MPQATCVLLLRLGHAAFDCIKRLPYCNKKHRLWICLCSHTFFCCSMRAACLSASAAFWRSVCCACTSGSKSSIRISAPACCPLHTTVNVGSALLHAVVANNALQSAFKMGSLNSLLHSVTAYRALQAASKVRQPNLCCMQS